MHLSWRAFLQCGDWCASFSWASSLMALSALTSHRGKRWGVNIRGVVSAISIILLLLPLQTEAGCPFQNPFWFLDRSVGRSILRSISGAGPPWWLSWTARARWCRTGFGWVGVALRTSSVSTTSKSSTTKRTTGYVWFHQRLYKLTSLCTFSDGYC